MPEMTALLLRQPPDDLCLAFVNTKFWRGTATPTEQLRAPADLLGWCAAECGWHPAALPALQASSTLFSVAIALREALWRIFSATSGAEAVDPADLALLNEALAAAPPRLRLRQAEAGLLWEVPDAAAVPAYAPVLWSAGDLLSGRRLARVRQCANPQCRWVFLDDSKSGSRRWCTMSACGNRAKAQRHYARHRHAG